METVYPFRVPQFVQVFHNDLWVGPRAAIVTGTYPERFAESGELLVDVHVFFNEARGESSTAWPSEKLMNRAPDRVLAFKEVAVIPHDGNFSGERAVFVRLPDPDELIGSEAFQAVARDLSGLRTQVKAAIEQNSSLFDEHSGFSDQLIKLEGSFGELEARMTQFENQVQTVLGMVRDANSVKKDPTPKSTGSAPAPAADESVRPDGTQDSDNAGGKKKGKTKG